MEKAKKEQASADVIKRAIEKAKGANMESYSELQLEGFGPGNSMVVVECLTDNANRSVSDVRTVLNKCKVKMGAMGSVAYMYDNLCAVGFSGLEEDDVMNALIENDIDFIIVYKNDRIHRSLYNLLTMINDLQKYNEKKTYRVK